MSKKLLSVCSLLVVTGLAGTVLADAKQWTNASPANDSWCEPTNWSPTGVPGSSDTAIIDATSPDRGPVAPADCDVHVQAIIGPEPNFGHTQVMDVNGYGTFDVYGDWTWRNGAGTAIINISGTRTVTIAGSWRGTDNGISTINISGSPNIDVAGTVRGADEYTGEFYVNMSGGHFTIGGNLAWADNGWGELNMSGGTIIVGGALDVGGNRGTAPINLNISDGLIRINGIFRFPSSASRAGNIWLNLDGGVIDCNEFVHGGGHEENPTYTDDWRVDIEQGTLKIKGDLVDAIDANVAAGQITAYDGEGVVVVELVHGDTVVTAIAPDLNRALNPRPRDLAVSVDPNTLLSWNPGINATTHHIYFGTDFDDVNTATTSSSVYMTSQAVDQNSYDPNGPLPLKLITTYYWRIDEERAGPVVTKGRVWQFTTRRNMADPNLRLWYPFDETGGYRAADYSGYGHDGVLDGPDSLWDPGNGHDGGARIFDGGGREGETVVDVPKGVLENIGGEITVAVWLRDAVVGEDEGPADNFVCGVGAGGETVPHQMLAVYPTVESDLMWRAGDDACDVLRWDLKTIGGDTIDPEAIRGWHFWTFIKSESQDKMEVYFDGELQTSKDDVNDTLANIRDSTFKVGSCPWESYSFVGAMDDFMVFDYAVSALKVAKLYRGGELGRAWAPKPYDHQTDVSRDTDLTWSPGNWVVMHDVYFGTDWDDVNDANTSDGEIYKGSKNLGEESYELPTLTLEQTYYWRIDEVNDSNLDSPWKGNVWTFTVANFLVVDDMEDYDDDASMPQNPINGTWIDGWWNYTGSTVYLEYGSDAALHGGAKSMWLEYDNNYGYPVENYSEIHANTATGDKNLGFGKDWTVDGMKALTLYFYGDANNVVEPLYVALEDTGTPGNMYVSNYGDDACEDINDLIEADWRQWDVRLSDFWDGNNVDINDVNKIYIGLGDRDNPVAGGTGLLYIDDIRLYLPKCVPCQDKPALDFSGNCIVDLADVAMMGNEWLRSDAYLSVSPPRNPPVGWWKLDGDATDSSASSYHGAAQGNYRWVTGHIDGAVEFLGSGGSVQVPDGGSTPLLRPANQISVTAWVKYSERPTYGARLVTKGVDAGDNENFALQVGTSLSWFVRDVNHTLHGPEDEADLYLDEWTHAAGTYDGSTVGIYANGRLESSAVIGAITLLQDTSPLSIGDAVDVYRALIGKVDDVRLYNYGLLPEEVAYIATQSTGGAGMAYMPLLSQVNLNLYNKELEGQRAVNFKDYAVLMDAWLEEVLWP